MSCKCTSTYILCLWYVLYVMSIMYICTCMYKSREESTSTFQLRDTHTCTCTCTCIYIFVRDNSGTQEDSTRQKWHSIPYYNCTCIWLKIYIMLSHLRPSAWGYSVYALYHYMGVSYSLSDCLSVTWQF